MAARHLTLLSFDLFGPCSWLESLDDAILVLTGKNLRMGYSGMGTARTMSISASERPNKAETWDSISLESVVALRSKSSIW